MTKIGGFVVGLAVMATSVGAGSDARAAATQMGFGNGLRATVYSADDLAARLTTYAGSAAILLPDGRYLPVITDINDPAIYNKGDGSFHPFSSAMLERVLAAVEHPRMALEVRVYLLPYPRRNVLVSSTSGNELFLSPHVLDIDPSVGAYIIAHELGHAFHNRFMPEGSSAWTDYRRLRGIQDTSKYYDTASHAYRPREIFAEDFRVLFGGAEAAFDGRIENTEIASPDVIPGLDSFMIGLATARGREARIAATSYPNPFNPETEIRIGIPVDLAERGERVTVRVYDVTGALVRTLHEGRASDELTVGWDGRDATGNRVASATYYAAIEVGQERQTLKLVLLK
jgi:hypothetical protein